MATFNEILSNLLNKEGVKKVNSLMVKNVNVEDKGNYVQVALTLNKSVDRLVTNEETGDVEERSSNIVFTSTYALGAVLRENEDSAFAGSYVIEHPKALKVLLSGAHIDIVQETVKSGEEYSNPWSTNENPTTTSFEHDTIINHLVAVRFGKSGEKALDKIADALLFAEED